MSYVRGGGIRTVKKLSQRVRRRIHEQPNTERRFPKIDQKDMRMVGLMIAGYDNKKISAELQIPLSTVQRRTRQILEKGLVQHSFKPSYKQLGLKKGMIHVYMTDGDMRSTAENVSKLNGITSVAIHIGNSDVVADFVYRDSGELVDILSAIKKIEGVERAVWSEEVFVFPTNSENTISAYQKLIVGGAR